MCSRRLESRPKPHSGSVEDDHDTIGAAWGAAVAIDPKIKTYQSKTQELTAKCPGLKKLKYWRLAPVEEKDNQENLDIPRDNHGQTSSASSQVVNMEDELDHFLGQRCDENAHSQFLVEFRALVENVWKLDDVSVEVFGSHALGVHLKDSDIDVCMLRSKSCSLKKRTGMRGRHFQSLSSF
jgi:predicted nucleotidyltransferase